MGPSFPLPFSSLHKGLCDYASTILLGIRVCRGTPVINHLLFADDTLIFYKATLNASNHLLKILSEYALASGQGINHDKTTMVFSRNVKKDTRVKISAI